ARRARPWAKGKACSRAPEDRVALLAHELGHVPAAEPALAGRSRALPAAERLEARPGAGRRPARAVGVEYARLDGGEEAVELVAVLGENAGGQAEIAAVGVGDGGVEVVERLQADERQEQLVAIDPVVRGQAADDGRGDVGTLVEQAALQLLAAKDD